MNTVQRIKNIQNIKSISSYLEVGVLHGATFENVDIERKVAVDVEFQYDVSKTEKERVNYYEMSSDEFFLSKCNGEKFDLVFLDGLHHFNQTLRDFCNTITATHKDSIIIIDDVYPTDIFSSLTNGSLKHRLQYDPSSKARAWHGDVYKTILFIHDYFPSYSYMTIDKEYGNSQTILVNRERKFFKPAFHSVEEIERIDYFKFLEIDYLLNISDELTALEWLKATL